MTWTEIRDLLVTDEHAIRHYSSVEEDKDY